MIFISNTNMLINMNIMENKKNEETKKGLESSLDGFLASDPNESTNPDMDCSSGVCVIKGDKSLVERINKKIITEDGRQLLF